MARTPLKQISQSAHSGFQTSCKRQSPTVCNRACNRLCASRAVQTSAERAAFEAHEEGPQTSAAHLVEFQAGVYTVEGAFTTLATTGDVWEVLTDYERLSDVFSNIKSSEVVRRDPEIVLHQVDSVKLSLGALRSSCPKLKLPANGKFGTQLSVREDWGALRLSFQLIESSFMNSFLGEWHLEKLKNGSGARVHHRMTVEPAISPPPFMTDYTQRIFVQQVARILRDLEEEMQQPSCQNSKYRDL